MGSEVNSIVREPGMEVIAVDMSIWSSSLFRRV